MTVDKSKSGNEIADKGRNDSSVPSIHVPREVKSGVQVRIPIADVPDVDSISAGSSVIIVDSNGRKHLRIVKSKTDKTLVLVDTDNKSAVKGTKSTKDAVKSKTKTVTAKNTRPVKSTKTKNTGDVDSEATASKNEDKNGDNSEAVIDDTDFVPATPPHLSRSASIRDALDHANDVIYDHLPSPLKTIWARAGYAISETIGKTKRAGQRVSKGYDDHALWNLGDEELRRLSKMLVEFAETTHGYPSSYIQDDTVSGIKNGREHWLDKHENDYDEWLESRWAPAGLNTLDWSHATVEDINRSLNETVREYGPDAAAWIQDLYHASVVLGRYADTYDYRVEHYDDLKYGLDSNEHYETIEAEFKRVWAWLGDVILNIWD